MFYFFICVFVHLLWVGGVKGFEGVMRARTGPLGLRSRIPPSSVTATTLAAKGFGKKTELIIKPTSDRQHKPPHSGMSGEVQQHTSEFRPIDSTAVKSIPLSEIDLSSFSSTFNLSYPGLRCISADPPVFEIDNFLPVEVCDSYIASSQTEGHQTSSKTFSSATSSMRTSSTWFMFYRSMSVLLQNALALTGEQLSHCEEPQIVRYEFGQQFAWHYDMIPASQLRENGGQRRITLIVYLNDVATGGATCFRDLNLKVTPKKGKALLFFPSFKDGTPDDRTLHAGQVALDTKWIAQLWIHENQYRPNLPFGNKHADVLPQLLSNAGKNEDP